jgi:glutathione S-transferase
MIEEDQYWSPVYARWIDDRFWSTTRDVFKPMLPPIVRNFLPATVRKDIKKTLHSQGIGRHAEEEIYNHAEELIDVFSERLGERPCFSTDAPTVFDAASYGMFENFIHGTQYLPQKAAAKKHANIVRYTENLRDSCFPEFKV